MGLGIELRRTLLGLVLLKYAYSLVVVCRMHTVLEYSEYKQVLEYH